MQCILAIDQGTTGSRAVLYNKDGRPLISAYQEFPQYFPKPGWVEHDAEEIWASVYGVIQKVLKDESRAEVVALGITNQRETTLVWDRKTGRPIHRAIVWQCRRTAERCAALKKNLGEREFFLKKTGLPVDAYFSATKIEWLLKNVADAAVRARRGELAFGTVDTWLLWKLTGARVHATDYTNASRTMLFDIGVLRWDGAILDKLRIPASLLPEVKNSSSIFATTQKTGRLPGGIPIAGIAGDQQAALFGQACFEVGSIKNTYGTGCFLLFNAGAKRPVSKFGLITTLGVGADGSPVYVLEGAVFVAGAAIQWLRDGLRLLKNASESERMAAALADNGGVYFVPAFVGLGAPYWDSGCRGGLFGLTRGADRRHLVRAALEAICYQTRDVLEAMEKDSGRRISELKVDGGAVKNNFLCQFQADILGVKVVRPRITEVTSLGAAYLAGLSTGFWKSADDVRRHWQAERVFHPKMPRKKAQRFYDGWLRAVKRILSFSG